MRFLKRLLGAMTSLQLVASPCSRASQSFRRPRLPKLSRGGSLQATAIPSVAAIDAVHVAIAATHGVDFLVTWNCTHIANAVVREKIEAVCRAAGFRPPVICTPLELRVEEDQ